MGEALLAAIGWLDENVSEAALIAVPAIIVAILLPLAIFLADRGEIQYSFDKNVIFRKILLFKVFIPTVLVTSVVLLLNYKPLSLVAVAVLLVETTCMLVRTYRWFCSYELSNTVNYRQKLRLDFLNGIKSQRELLETWGLILSDKDLAHKNQVGLMDAFIDAVKRIEDDEYGAAKSTLLRQLNGNLGKISFYNVDVFKKLVKFASGYYRQEREFREHNDVLASPYELRNLLMNLMQKAFEEKEYTSALSYVFFTEIEVVLQGSCDDLRGFMRDLFASLETSSVNLFHLWQNKFLKELVVTDEALKNGKLKERTRIIFQSYLEYMMEKLMRLDELDDRKIQVLEKATEYILREVDPRLWLDLMSFCYMGLWVLLDGKDAMYSRIVAWCKIKTVVGAFGRMHVFSRTDNGTSDDQKIREIDDAERRETVYLAIKVQPWLGDEHELQKVLDTIHEIIRNEELGGSDTYEYNRLMCFERCIEKVAKVLGFSLES